MFLYTPTMNQRGTSTVKVVIAFIALGTVFLIVFLLSLSSTGPGSQQPSNAQQEATNTKKTNQPEVIRIPEGYKVYTSDTYKFSFAFPATFGDLTTDSTVVSKDPKPRLQLKTNAVSKLPLAGSDALLNGSLAVHVYPRSSFKLTLTKNDVVVAPTTTGNDITWKVVNVGTATDGTEVGQSRQVPNSKSDAGVTVFDLALRNSSNSLGRLVFASGDSFVLIALPAVSKPNAADMTGSDSSAYNSMLSSISKTIRLTED